MQDNKINNIFENKIKHKMMDKILKDNLNRIPLALNKINKNNNN